MLEDHRILFPYSDIILVFLYVILNLFFLFPRCNERRIHCNNLSCNCKLQTHCNNCKFYQYPMHQSNFCTPYNNYYNTIALNVSSKNFTKSTMDKQVFEKYLY